MRFAPKIAALCILLTGCDAAPSSPNHGADNDATANTRPIASAPIAPVADRKAPSVDSPAMAGPAIALTSAGWGPLTVGMTLAQITTAMGPDAEPELVGGPEPDMCDQFRPARAPRGVLVMTEANRLSRVSLIRPSTLVTDRGFGLGAKAAEVSAAYGAQAVSTPHKYNPAPAAYITVWSANPPRAGAPAGPAARGLVYEIDTSGRVQAIHAGGPAIQYVEGCA